MISPGRILAVFCLMAPQLLWAAAAGAQFDGEFAAANDVPGPPVPRPDPGLPQGPAIELLRTDEGLSLPVPYAPAATPFEQVHTGESELILEAHLTEYGPPLKEGVTWRVFGADPGVDGVLPLLATSIGGTTSFQLPAGTYYVHAAFGRAGAVKRVEMGGRSLVEPINLDAGGLRLTAVIGEDQPADPKDVTFEIYKDTEDGERVQLVEDAPEEPVLRLNAGTYHVVSRYGAVNAIVRADIQVNAGKLTEATIRHKGAEVTLKLVEAPGGEALANTRWTVLTPAGDVLHNSVGAFPSIILAEGTYTAYAHHRGRNYTRDFDVEAGIDRDVEVLLSDLESQSADIHFDP